MERCQRCRLHYPLDLRRWRCRCGGLLDLLGPPVDPLEGVGAASPWSLWRYRAALPPLAVGGADAVTLGEGLTPLVAAGGGWWLKLDFVAPTLSFKDRGAAVVVAAARASGVDHLVVDSSGNAGVSFAAYGARAGAATDVFVPVAASPAKVAATARFGAAVHSVDGPRAAAASAAQRHVERTGGCYASHVWQPLFTQGTKTIAYELFEQLGARPPSTVVVPVGNGTLLVGLALGFADLVAAGRADVAPRLIAVQAAACAPLAGQVPAGPTAAEGIAVPHPPRAEQLLKLLAGHRGTVVTVDEEDIVAARAQLAHLGVDVEPTAATAWAAATRLQKVDDPAVVVLGGAGLKAPDGRRGGPGPPGVTTA